MSQRSKIAENVTHCACTTSPTFITPQERRVALSIVAFGIGHKIRCANHALFVAYLSLLPICLWSQERTAQQEESLQRLEKGAAEAEEARSRGRKKYEEFLRREKEREKQEKERKELLRREFEEDNKDLIRAWEYQYSKGRDREKAIKLWMTYLERNEDTPFRGEIYYRIATLFSTHRGNDSYSIVDAEKWYKKALPLYSSKCSTASMTAWGTLCNYPERRHDIEYKKEYYDWLVELSTNGSADELYGYNTISSYLRYMVMELSMDEREKRMAHQRGHIRDNWLVATRDNILQFASIDDLINLSKSYPNDTLGRQAKERLETVRDDGLSVIEESIKELNSENGNRPSEGAVPPPDESKGGHSSSGQLEDADRSVSSGHLWWIAGGIALFSVAATAVRRRLRAANNRQVMEDQPPD